MQFRLWRAAAFVSSPIHLFAKLYSITATDRRMSGRQYTSTQFDDDVSDVDNISDVVSDKPVKRVLVVQLPEDRSGAPVERVGLLVV